MQEIRRFNFSDINDLNIKIKKFNLKASEKIDIITKPTIIYGKEIPNRIVAHPMEGVDAVDGAPGALTLRKYKRISEGGYGIVWVEACSVTEDGMSNDNQLFLKDSNVEKFRELNNLIKSSSLKSQYKKEAYTVLQLNHSGRYANKNKIEAAKIATHRHLLDKKRNIEQDRNLITDTYLEDLENKYLHSAILSKKAGFDCIDIKACHGYLNNELLSAKDRDGLYGGCLINRSRFMLNVIDKIKNEKECEGLDIAVRLNVFDKTENGFCTDENLNFCPEDLYKLIDMLYERGVKLISITLGNPYFIPNINKPYDLKKNEDLESPIKSCERIIKISRNLQEEYPDIFFVGVGYTWFREFGVNVAENEIKNEEIKLAGFGRQILAYPDMPNDLLEYGHISKEKVCVTCNMCSKLKATYLPTGCVVRDGKTYKKYLDELMKG